MKDFKRQLLNNIFPIITVIIMVVFWQLLSLAIDMEIVLPAPVVALKEFFNCFTVNVFYLSCVYTLLRAIICYLACFLFGGILAYISYKKENFKNAIKPIIGIFRSIPTMSIILLVLLWLNEDIAPIVIAFIVVFPISYSSHLSGYNSLDLGVFKMAKVYQIPNKLLYKKYVFPTFLDRVLESTVTELLLCFKIVISGEVMSETARGLGVLIKNSKLQLETGKLFAYTIVALILGFLLEIALKLIIKSVRRERGNDRT